MQSSRFGGRLVGERAWEVEKSPPYTRRTPSRIIDFVDSLQVCFQATPALFRQLGIRHRLREPGFRREGGRRRGSDLVGQTAVEVQEIGVSLLDGKGTERKAQGNVVDRVGLGGTGDGGIRY